MLPARLQPKRTVLDLSRVSTVYQSWRKGDNDRRLAIPDWQP